MSTERPNYQRKRAGAPQDLSHGSAPAGADESPTGTGPRPARSKPEAQIPDEIRAWIEHYKPQEIAAEEWESGELRDFVVSTLKAAAAKGIPVTGPPARVLSLIGPWCQEQEIPLDIERVLDPDTVERFITEGATYLPSRITYRSALRRLGRELTKTAPWAPRPEAITHGKTAPPYTAEELAQVWDDACHQSNSGRIRVATGMVALGAGAGFDGGAVRRARGTDVTSTNDGVIIHARSRVPRDVVVLRVWEGTVLDLAAQAGDGTVLGVSATSTDVIYDWTNRFDIGHAHPKLSIPRLRSTWIVTHLVLGTRLPELMAAAGTRSVATFDRLLRYVAAMDERETRRMLRGPELA